MEKVNKFATIRKIIICRGLPASGKSTWSKSWVLVDPQHRVRINQDDIRLMLGKYWIPSREPLVSHIQQEAVIKAMSLGLDIVLDNVNLNPKTIKSYVDIANANKYDVEYKDFF